MAPLKKQKKLKIKKPVAKKALAEVDEDNSEQVEKMEEGSSHEDDEHLNDVEKVESGDDVVDEKDEDDGDDEDEKEKVSVDPEEKQRKSGVIYFPSIPPKFTVKRLNEYFEKIAPGQIGRIFLMRNKHSKKAESRYSEGWMELKRKKTAKMIASTIDNTQVGGKRRDFVSSMFWNIRYLSGFKWVHLTEQLQYEKEVEKRRMNVEILQARRVAAHFEEQIAKGQHLKKLEEKVKAQGGKWSSFTRDVQQKSTIKKNKKGEKETAKTTDDDLMKMIFD